jgi:hypothetical protein
LNLHLRLEENQKIPTLKILELQDDKLVEIDVPFEVESLTALTPGKPLHLLIAKARLSDDWTSTQDQHAYAVTASLGGKVIAASAVHFSFMNKVLYWLRPIDLLDEGIMLLNTNAASGCMSREPQSAQGISTSPDSRHGSIYEPLDPKPSGNEPISGSVCMQRSSVVGFDGGMIISEINSGECISGWDGFCDASACQSAVGSTYKQIDPLVLLGG